jgi:glycosyltransferase involved in cell wall biosynthesis
MILSDSHVYKSHGLYHSPDPWLKVAEYLEPFFSSILLCVPLGRDWEGMRSIALSKDWESKRIRWIHTFAHESVINYYKFLPMILVKNVPILVRAMRESDILFMRLPAMNGLVAELAARRLGKPVVCYFSGDQRVQIFNGGKYRGPWAVPARMVATFHDVLFQKMVRRAKASIFEAEATMERFGYTNGHCTFMFPSTIEEHQIWSRPEVSHGDRPRKLLFVGSVDMAKGIKFLLEAMASLVRMGVTCTLDICGEGPERQSLEQLAKQLGLNDSVTFRGHVRWGEELTAIYRSSDILVHPSLSEGVPKVVLEAMANGVAVVATSVGGIPRVVNHEHNGLLVAPKSAEAIFEAVSRLVGDHYLWNRLVQGGYSFIREHTAQKQARKLADIVLSSVDAVQVPSLECCRWQR